MKQLFCIFTIILYFNTLEAADIIGKVVGVIDGDTINILQYLNNGRKKLYKVKLSNIDAPEIHQPFGKKSKKMLSNLIYNKWVHLESFEKDLYGRYLGTVYFDNKNINHEQVKNGMAWVYRKYCKDRVYYELEKQARDNFRGIWSQPNPIPPWKYRSYKKGYETISYYSKSSRSLSNCFKCEQKRFCREMSSCKEAYFYLNKCGLYRLDGDHDGIPCESICGHYR